MWSAAAQQLSMLCTVRSLSRLNQGVRCRQSYGFTKTPHSPPPPLWLMLVKLAQKRVIYEPIANSHSASLEIPRLTWNPKVHYRVHKIPPLVPILSQMHPVHTFPHYSSNRHSNIILTSTLRSYNRSLSSMFPCHIFYTFIIYPVRATCPAHSLFLDTLSLSGEK
jgi:hypothetical protein